jgi:putative SOS response-associated peptidase YedK
MCGRYASFLPAEAVARLFHTANPLPNFPPTWNMAPTQDAMVVRHHPETGERHLDLLKWGLLPYFTKEPVHAKRFAPLLDVNEACPRSDQKFGVNLVGDIDDCSVHQSSQRRT